EFLLSLFAFIAVALLQLTDHFLSLPLNLGDVVVSKLAPPGTDFPFYLVPSALKNLRIHANLLSLRFFEPQLTSRCSTNAHRNLVRSFTEFQQRCAKQSTAGFCENKNEEPFHRLRRQVIHIQSRTVTCT